MDREYEESLPDDFTGEEEIYSEAVGAMQSATQEEDFYYALCLFRKIPDFQDASSLALYCESQKENLHNETIYKRAVERLLHSETWTADSASVQAYEASIAELKTLGEWKDVPEKLALYQSRLFNLQTLVAKNKAIQEENLSLKRKKRKKRIVFASSLSTLILVGILFSVAILFPPVRYHKFLLKIDENNCEERYAKLYPFRNFEPINRVLKNFVWIPSELIITSDKTLISTKLVFEHAFTPGEIQSRAKAYFAPGKPSPDSDWTGFDMDILFYEEFDLRGNLISKKVSAGEYTFTAEYIYNNTGQCIEQTQTYPNKKTVTTHTYNTDNTKKSSVSVDKNNRASIHSYIYDDKNNIIREKITSPSNLVTTIDYIYDKYQNVLRKTTLFPDDGTETEEYLDYEVYYIG